MKSLKILSTLFIVAGSVLTFASCSKDKGAIETVTKDQLTGKWDLIMQTSILEHDQVTLKAGGAMEIDWEPYDGIPDMILLWDVKSNAFTAHLDANGVSNLWKLDAPIDPKTLSMAGQLIANDGVHPPMTVVFTMDKQ